MSTEIKQTEELQHCKEGEKVMLHFYNGETYQGYFKGFDGDETIMLQALGNSTLIGLPLNMLQYFETYNKSDRNMKGKPFSKIFETENGQVLVSKNYDAESEKHSLKYQMNIEIANVIVEMESELKEDKLAKEDIHTLFENCDIDTATEVSKMIINQLT